jgi:hypothetical protein
MNCSLDRKTGTGIGVISLQGFCDKNYQLPAKNKSGKLINDAGVMKLILLFKRISLN